MNLSENNLYEKLQKSGIIYKSSVYLILPWVIFRGEHSGIVNFLARGA
jgi:hypothetical protein